MKSEKAFLFCAVLFFHSFAFAQQDTVKSPPPTGWYLFGINLHGGVMGDRNFNTFDLPRLKAITKDQDVFLVLPPDSLKTGREIDAEKIRRHEIFSASLSYRPDRGGDDYVNELRIGITYYGGAGDNLIYSYTDTPDTSDKRNLRTKYYRFQGDVSQLTIEPAYLFKTNPFWRKFGTYSGIGLTLGYSVRSNYKYIFKEEHISIDSTNGKETIEIVNETSADFEVKPSFNFGAYIPIGIKYRISDRFVIRGEGRLGFNVLYSNSGTPFFNYQRGAYLVLTYRVNRAKSRELFPWTF